MSNSTSAVTSSKSKIRLNYQLIRNTTSPDEQESGVKSFVANLPAFEILRLDTEDNLRGYIAEYSEDKRNEVHEAIRETIDTMPQRFITRNSGFVIVAADVDVDDGKKVITLSNASIINGAQSQGEINRYYKDLIEVENGAKPDDDFVPFHIRCEIIVDPDEKQVVETAIARNTMTPVKSVSQAGARGHLEDLEKSIQAVLPGCKIKKSETDIEGFDTRKVLQYSRLLMPVAVSKSGAASERLRAYKNPEQCLTDFTEWHKDSKKNSDAKIKYDFMVQIAPFAIQEFRFWSDHEAWNGQHIQERTKKGGRACKRKNGKVYEMAPGIIYPIMGAMSEFVTKNTAGSWVISKPDLFNPDEMVARAANQFFAHSSDPMAMGRSEAAYDAVRIYTQTLMQVIRSMERKS